MIVSGYAGHLVCSACGGGLSSTLPSLDRGVCILPATEEAIEPQPSVSKLPHR